MNERESRSKGSGPKKQAIARLLGFSGMSEAARNHICDENMRLAEVLSATVAVVVCAVIVMGLVVPAAGEAIFSNPALLFAISAAIIAVCTVMNVYAHRYLARRVRGRRRAYAVLAAFIAANYVYAIVLSTVSYAYYGQVGLFYIFLVAGSVLFLLRPLNQAIITLGALTSFLAVFHILGMGNTMFFTSATCIAVAVMVAGAIRYNQQRRWALATIEAIHAAEVDGLTGLSNRMCFDKEFPTFAGRFITVAMTDVDDFKYFNDAYSHELGDKVLRLFARTLKRSFPNDRLYRYGGDEFVVVSEREDAVSFQADADTFLATLETSELEGAEGQTVSASMGFAAGTPKDTDGLGALIHLADRKLYEAKRDGKGRAFGGALAKMDMDREVASAAGLPFRHAFESDDLTGLPNIQYFRAHGMRFAEYLAECGQVPALVHFNLANFKLVNERKGYKAGDALLTATAEAVQKAFPRMLAARIAEDRFAVICPEDRVAEGVKRAGAIVDLRKGESTVSLKAGVYVIPLDLADIGDAYDAAKAACDSIKGVHGQDMRVFDADLQEKVQRRRYVFEHIGPAIKQHRIEVYYQPVYRAVTGKMCGAEALVRWRDDRYGIIPPADFIGILEDAQRISELDSYVVARVCDDLAAARDEGLPVLPVSVNFSRIDFQLVDVAGLVEQHVRRLDLPRQLLRIEVTESAFTQEDERLSAQIDKLRSMGFQVWMDDFGSGYSSLSQLDWHDFDVVKIDMAFLRKFEDEQTRNMLTSIVDMVKRLGVQTLVEGVETEAQYEFMRAIGCELIQGYYFSRPIDRSAYHALLAGPAESIEPFDQRGYYNAISHVNPLSQTPFSFGASGYKAEAGEDSVALAVLEYDSQGMRFLVENNEFRCALSSLGMGTPEAGARLLAERAKDPVSQVAQFIGAIEASSGTVAVDFLIRGEDCLVRGRRIASFEDRQSVLLSLQRRTVFQVHADRAADMSIRLIYMLYDRIDVADGSTGKVENVYLRAADPEEASAFARGSEETGSYIEGILHPDDVERFRAYVDASTVEERLSRVEKGFLVDTFRMLMGKGTYAWKAVLIVPLETNGKRFLMYCRRDADSSVAERSQTKGGITEAMLWRAMMKLVPEKVFWKDANRRFIGANRAFLDYYGFSSERAILGKTDEDMGWHIDPDPFMRDEMSVIDRGESVTAAVGTCIADGKMRHIIAYKDPLVRAGRVLGLIGYFTDVEQAEGTKEKQIAAASLDSSTGLLNSLGTVNVLSVFENDRVDNEADYGVVYLDVDNLRAINREHGHTFGDRVLAEVGRALATAMGSRGIVGHLRTDEFVVISSRREGSVRQKKAALDDVARCAQAAVADVEEVDSVACNPTASAGCALRSEALNVADLVEMAEKRMRDGRDAMHFDLFEKGVARDWTMSDVRRRMAVLKGHFDLVRMVDVSTCRAWELAGGDGRRFASPERCFAKLGRCNRCVNCISSKSLADGKVHKKYQRTKDGVLLMISRYLQVDGEPYALETATNLGIDASFGDAGIRRFGEEVADIDARAYFDQATGAYNRRYLKDVLLHLRGRRAAELAVESGADGADLDERLGRIVRAVRGNLAPNDAVVRIGRSTFAIVFDPFDAPGTDETRKQLAKVRADAAAAGSEERDAAADGAPEAEACRVSIGAAVFEDTVEQLLQGSERALYRARDGEGLVILGA